VCVKERGYNELKKREQRHLHLLLSLLLFPFYILNKTEQFVLIFVNLSQNKYRKDF